MATQTVFIEGIGEVVLAKRRGSRTMRLSINSSGRVRVGIPNWVPYRAAIKFAQDRQDWIIKQQALSQQIYIKDGLKIGKSHTLHFIKDPKLSSLRAQVDNTNINIISPYDESDPKVQQKALIASEKALKKEAETLLPQRVKELGTRHGYIFEAISVKKLTSRWGSCSSSGVVTLSYYLMQLPWQLIDYVILHELVHTKHMNHSPKFWAQLDKLAPGVKELQKQIRTHKPRVEPWDIKI
jgi:predicted metal-dependent hydrolase